MVYSTWDHHARHISTRSNKTNSNTSFDLSEELCNISLHCTASVFLFPSCPTSCFYLSFYRNTHAALICMYCWSFATQLDMEAKVKLNSLMPFIDEWKQHILLIHPKMMYINLRASHNAAWPFSITKVTKKGQSDAYRRLRCWFSQPFDCNQTHTETVQGNWFIFLHLKPKNNYPKNKYQWRLYNECTVCIDNWWSTVGEYFQLFKYT